MESKVVSVPSGAQGTEAAPTPRAGGHKVAVPAGALLWAPGARPGYLGMEA